MDLSKCVTFGELYKWSQIKYVDIEIQSSSVTGNYTATESDTLFVVTTHFVGGSGSTSGYKMNFYLNPTYGMDTADDWYHTRFGIIWPTYSFGSGSNNKWIIQLVPKNSSPSASYTVNITKNMLLIDGYFYLNGSSKPSFANIDQLISPSV